jgi:hypothetical protein
MGNSIIMADLYSAPRGHIVMHGKGKSIARLSPGLNGEQSLLIISGIGVVRNQVTQYIKTLDDKLFGYAWGEGPGKIQVNGIIFHAPNCQPSGDGYGAVNGYYDSNNVYKKGGPCALSIGGAGLSGYLERMTLSASMTEFNWGEFSLEMTIISGSQ